MSDILADLADLHQQATTERSHDYVGLCCKRAIKEIRELREMNLNLLTVLGRGNVDR